MAYLEQSSAMRVSTSATTTLKLYWLNGSFKQRSKVDTREDGEFLKKGLGQETRRCIMGLSHGLQNTHWNVTVSTSLQKGLSSACRVGAQSMLGHQEVESQHRGYRRKKITTTK